MQLSVFPSGIQIAGTKCSTFPRGGFLSSSSGKCGSACNVRRRWFVEAEEVSVELGFMMVRVVIREALADRIPSTHASRSSLLAIVVI